MCAAWGREKEDIEKKSVIERRSCPFVCRHKGYQNVDNLPGNQLIRQFVYVTCDRSFDSLFPSVFNSIFSAIFSSFFPSPPFSSLPSFPSYIYVFCFQLIAKLKRQTQTDRTCSIFFFFWSFSKFVFVCVRRR